MANNITRWEPESPPNLLLAIDPGAAYPGRKDNVQLPYAGCAVFQHGFLVWAGLVKCPANFVNAAGVSVKSPAFARPNLLVRTVCKEANIARHAAGAHDAGGQKCGRCGRGGGVGNAGLGEPVTVLAVENPLLYKHGTARPADILALKAIYGAFMGGIDADFYSGPAPAEWKGSIDKTIMNEKTLAVLNKTEHTMLISAQAGGSGGLSDHTLDAVGLGAWVLGRIGTGGVV